MTITLALSLVFIIALCIYVSVRQSAQLPAQLPAQSRKHIRVTYWTFNATITYYNEQGRRCTKRTNIAHKDVARLVALAKAKGYRRA